MSVLEILESTGSVWIPDENFNEDSLLRYEGYVTTEAVGDAESRIAENIYRLCHGYIDSVVEDETIDAFIREFEATKNEGRTLHENQANAVKMVLNSHLSVLTGGPGTGKTTVLSAIAFSLRKISPQVRIVYTAPTGKAARRISESTGENASTLHSKLGLGYENQPEPFFEDVLFIDESSMLDLQLADNLFASIQNGRKVVLVGDVDQLPSVGIGAVLRDIIKSGCVPVTRLTHTFRQDNSSTLFANIQNIREGNPNMVEGSDFHPVKIANSTSRNDVAKMLRECYLDAVEKHGIDNVVLLLPFRQSKKHISSDVLNPFIQTKVNKQPQGFAYGDLFFCVNDLVMQLENREECANGDVGKVVKVSSEGIVVEYATATVFYQKQDMEQITLAYSMTIHKSQGSEYKHVIMCVLDEHEQMLNRNLIYTGVTRAKKECTVVYHESAYKKAIATIANDARFSMLAEKIRSLEKQLC